MADLFKNKADMFKNLADLFKNLADMFKKMADMFKKRGQFLDVRLLVFRRLVDDLVTKFSSQFI